METLRCFAQICLLILMALHGVDVLGATKNYNGVTFTSTCDKLPIPSTLYKVTGYPQKRVLKYAASLSLVIESV